MVAINQIENNQIINSKHKQPVGFYTVLLATIRKDLTIWKRYKANLLSGLVSMIVMALVFGLFANVSEFRGLGLTKNQQFIFFMVGIILTVFTNSSMWAPINTVQNDMYNGTLEYIHSTGGSKWAYFLGTSIADGIIRMIYFLPLTAILLYYSNTAFYFLGYALLIMSLSIIAFLSIGVVFASLAILYKQIGALTGIIATALQFFAGAYIPLIALPRGFQYAALLFPHTYVFDLTRYYTMNGNWPTLFPVWLEWILFACYFIIILLGTKVLLRKVEGKAEEAGLHLI